MTRFTLILLGALALNAHAQRTDPFQPASRAPAAQAPAPPPAQPGSLPPLAPPVGEQGVAGFPHAGMPAGPEKRVERVTVTRVGTVNGRLLLRGNTTYVWHDEEKMTLTVMPEIGTALDASMPMSSASSGGVPLDAAPPPPLPSMVGWPAPRP